MSSFFRFKFLVCVLLFLVIFVIVLLQELIVLDKFEYNFLAPKHAVSKEICKQDNRNAIDLVYTWVNGSDPQLQQLIKLYSQVNADDRCAELIEMPFLLVIPEIITSTYQKLISSIPKDDHTKQWIPVKYKIEDDISSSLFFFEDINKAREHLISKPAHLTNYKLNQLYFSKNNCNLTDEFKAIRLENAIKIKSSETLNLVDNLSKDLKVEQSKLINYKFNYNDHNIIGIDSKFNLNSLEALTQLKLNSNLYGEQVFNFKLIHDNLVANSNDDASSENRFNDKNELLYSLRSVEKYANWIRNIYIVTNGQIPNWLNTSHPQIKIIEHKDIYPNKSHLPTFNSASIECHLHRIKNLSKKFIYLNDDFLFGKNVYFDDFYSNSKGYQIRLSWPAPMCAKNCPTPWLNDGICDKACNTSLCLFDGGDCLKKNNETKLDAKSGFNAPVFESQLLKAFSISKPQMNYNCNFECPTSWLADEHCDDPCNTLECGYDLGDCKLDKIDQVFEGVNYLENKTIYSFNLTKAHKGVYLNMSSYFDGLLFTKELNELQLKSDDMKYIKKLVFNQINNLLFVFLEDKTVVGDRLGLNINMASSKYAKIKPTNFVLELHFNQLNSIDEVNRNNETNATNIINRDNFNNTNELKSTDNHSSINDTTPRLTTRSLMDFYSDSLSFSNYIINRKFKIQNRKVPAHMPILLDKEILERMNVELYDEIQETSSHRFRHSQDLQFAFTYYYFLMSEQFYPTIKQILEEFDLNNDKHLNKQEARTFYLRTSKNPFEEHNFESFWNESINCSKHREDDKILINDLVDCNDFNFLNDETKVRKRNEFTILKMDDVSFNQLNNDLNQVQTQLDSLRKEPKQFICINDNFSYKDILKIKKLNEILSDFFESILPLKSKFEKLNESERMLEQSTTDDLTDKVVNYRGFLLIFIIVCLLIVLFARICYDPNRTKFRSSINV